MQLFGKDLFTYKKEPEYLYDFAQHGIIQLASYPAFDPGLTNQTATFGSRLKQASVPKPKPQPTPKKLFEMKALNNNDFKINVDEKYLAAEIAQINEKLSFLGKAKKEKKYKNQPFPTMVEPGGIHFGRQELESILERLKNRYKINEFKEMLETYPHTSNELIGKLIKDNTHLNFEKAESYIPDFPKAAIKAMKEYTKMCLLLCNKKPVFYVVTQREDIIKKAVRRDPILLAQSPFGFFWQILGAWDKEMIYLGDL